MTELPKGWKQAHIGELASKIGSGATPKGGAKSYKSFGTPLVRSMNIHFDGVRDQGLAFIDDDQAKKLDNVQVETDDVLLNITGASIGRVALAPERYAGARVNQHVAIIRTVEGLDPSFLSRYLASPEAQVRILKENYGITRQALTKGMIETFPVTLPPLLEQRRIVVKLDRLSERSSSARDHLTRVTTLADRSKDALRRVAFSGELTKKWRSENGVDDPRQQILESVCKSVTDGDHQAPPKASEGVAFITISAINDGYLRLEKATRYVPQSYRDGLKEKRKAEVGDILFCVTGSIAIPALVDTVEPFVFQRHIAILKPDSGQVLSRYLFHVLGAPQVKEQALAVATGTAQLTIPLGKLRLISVPVPTPKEQQEIIRILDVAFARIDRLTEEATRASHLLDRLDERLLAKAFQGELVPQDPDDEPAEALLERIREAKATAPKPKRARRKKTA